MFPVDGPTGLMSLALKTVRLAFEAFLRQCIHTEWVPSSNIMSPDSMTQQGHLLGKLLDLYSIYLNKNWVLSIHSLVVHCENFPEWHNISVICSIIIACCPVRLSGLHQSSWVSMDWGIFTKCTLEKTAKSFDCLLYFIGMPMAWGQFAQSFH